MKQLTKALKKAKNLAAGVIKSAETMISTSLKVAIGLAVLGLVGLSGYLLTRSEANITSPTVMITSLKGGGGSGVVISRSKDRSQVLTNRHVCELLSKGGRVRTTSGDSHVVTRYAMSEMHDLCLLEVNADLKYSATIASRPPRLYEEATVSGHPNLLPNVISKGHFSGNKVINVLLGWRECTEKELEDQDLGMICFIFGGLPVVKTFETVLVTAMIMPGSSGSAVYNSKLEISGVVFAGSGEMSYAYIVPYEYVIQFLEEELADTYMELPNYVMDVKDMLKQESKRKPRKDLKSIKKECDKVEDKKLIDLCGVVIRDLEFRNNEN